MHQRTLQPIVIAISSILYFCSAASAQVTQSFTEPATQSNVAAAEPGVVVKIFVAEGDRVKPGQLLAELDSAALRQSLKIAKLRAKSRSELESAETLQKLRGNRRDTIAAMLKEGHANPSESEEAALEYEMAAAKVQEAKQKFAESQLEVDRIQAQLDNRMIFAPIAGVVTELHARKGEYISNNDPQFATLVQLDSLMVRFYLLESEVRGLASGQTVELRIGDQKAANKVKGTIDFVSPVTNSDSGTARVEVRIDNSNLDIRSGSPCQWIGLLAQPGR